MGERTQQLAERFEQANAAAIMATEGCSDEQWRTACSPEGWAVGVVMHHVAAGYAPISTRVRMAATGQEFPPADMEALHRTNAQHAEQHAHCTKKETVDLLRTDGAAAAQMIRSLEVESLQHSAVFGGGRPPMTVDAMIEHILIGHITHHLDSIQQVIGAA